MTESENLLLHIILNIYENVIFRLLIAPPLNSSTIPIYRFNFKDKKLLNNIILF